MTYRVSKIKNSIFLFFVLIVFALVFYVIHINVDGLSLRCTSFLTAGAGVGMFVIPVFWDFKSQVTISESGIYFCRRNIETKISWQDIRRLEFRGWLNFPVGDVMIIHTSTGTDIRQLPVIDFSFKNQREIYCAIMQRYRREVPDGIIDNAFFAIEKQQTSKS